MLCLWPLSKRGVTSVFEWPCAKFDTLFVGDSKEVIEGWTTLRYYLTEVLGVFAILFVFDAFVGVF